jgi:hypothetical protein
MRNYSEASVVDQLDRKADIRIQGKDIQIQYGESSRGDVGIKAKGKIDFLVNYCGYHKREVKKFN